MTFITITTVVRCWRFCRILPCLCRQVLDGVRQWYRFVRKSRNKFSFPVIFYLIVFAVIMGFGALFYRKDAVSYISERTDDEE